MKAYIVVTNEFTHPLFARYNMEARRKAMAEFSLEDEEIEKVKRAPELDKYLDYWLKWKEFDREKLIMDEGWWFNCQWCEGMVSKDMDDDDGNIVQPVFDQGIYCSQKCCDEEKAYFNSKKPVTHAQD